MNVQNLQTLATVLPVLAPLANGADHTAQRGRKLKVYRSEAGINGTTPALLAAVVGLLKLGVDVRVHEGKVISTPSLAADGVVVWTTRPSRKNRKGLKVEVVL